MKRLCSILLVASSVVWPTLTLAASRPHYGGTLRVAVKESPASLDTLASTGAAGLSGLVFENLVRLDERGQPQPLLALSWQAEPGNQRWRFFLRGGVSFSDGAPLDSSTVAASLRNSNSDWKVIAAGETVMIESESPDPDIPAELAMARNAIVRRSDGKLSGTGPFTIAQWVPGKHLVLAANEQCWAGRPFLDSIEVEFGKNYREQMVLLDLNKADVVQVAPESIHRAQAEAKTVTSSQPQELMALVFASEARSDAEAHARNALALSIGTPALNNVILQGGGEPTGALLPNWVSGYAFVFPSGGTPETVRQERTQAQQSPSWTLGHDASDPVAHLAAERISLNARDAGITLQLTSSSSSDVRLVRIPLPSSDARVALRELARSLQLPQPKFAGSSLSELYSAESTLLQTHRVIPLLHIRSAVAARPNVHNWNKLPDGTWNIGDAWLSAEKP
jgi:MarR-like DNA-binding transcriptional regulator SgrR of sgrS sRNA